MGASLIESFSVLETFMKNKADWETTLEIPIAKWVGSKKSDFSLPKF